MIKLCCILFFLIPFVACAQMTSVVSGYFRSLNANEKNALFMENESLPAPPITEPTHSITIVVTNIRNTNGVIRFKFYDASTSFPHDTGFLRIVVSKSEVINNTFTATYHGFIARQMGIALLDDENNNWELDMGWIFPKEGHAFSDYYHTSLRRPVYNDFAFVLTGDKEVKMRMKYY
jgi:uncharacterized protein (DUF2141 family)